MRAFASWPGRRRRVTIEIDGRSVVTLAATPSEPLPIAQEYLEGLRQRRALRPSLGGDSVTLAEFHSLVFAAFAAAGWHRTIRRWGSPNSSLLSALGFVASRSRTPLALAADLARDPLLKLSAADALYLALAATNGHTLLTFDQRLADAANACG